MEDHRPSFDERARPVLEYFGLRDAAGDEPKDPADTRLYVRSDLWWIATSPFLLFAALQSGRGIDAAAAFTLAHVPLVVWALAQIGGWQPGRRGRLAAGVLGIPFLAGLTASLFSTTSLLACLVLWAVLAAGHVAWRLARPAHRVPRSG